MILLYTVPIYTTPSWFIGALILTVVTLLITLMEGSGKVAEIIIMVCLAILIIGIILGICGLPKVYSHDEYIIELDENMSATEFFKNYEITKVFEYSNAWQVKKKDGVK